MADKKPGIIKRGLSAVGNSIKGGIKARIRIIRDESRASFRRKVRASFNPPIQRPRMIRPIRDAPVREGPSILPKRKELPRII